MSNLRFYATTPESLPQRIARNKEIDGCHYYKMVKESARWAESSGFHGSLIYSNNSLVDGLSVAQIILETTDQLTPLVAINPVYFHPYTLAKRIASLIHMYGKKIDINWIAGGFQNDLRSLGDNTPHDRRYERLLEFASSVNGLLRSSHLYSFEGEFYNLENVLVSPNIPQKILPTQLMSGTSESGSSTADKLGAIKVKYAKPLNDYPPDQKTHNYNEAIRFGIIARETSEEAWKIALERFPNDELGRKAHIFSTKVSDSKWMKDLSNIETIESKTYWLGPFKTYKTFCPYLVGSIEDVSKELSSYVKLGHSHIILDIMPEQEDYTFCQKVFKAVEEDTAVLFS